eukprot:3694147-Pleurochrysis_carterae.AAC.3
MRTRYASEYACAALEGGRGARGTHSSRSSLHIACAQSTPSLDGNERLLQNDVLYRVPFTRLSRRRKVIGCINSSFLTRVRKRCALPGFRAYLSRYPPLHLRMASVSARSAYAHGPALLCVQSRAPRCTLLHLGALPCTSVQIRSISTESGCPRDAERAVGGPACRLQLQLQATAERVVEREKCGGSRARV